LYQKVKKIYKKDVQKIKEKAVRKRGRGFNQGKIK
jgi:hypothetical protein